MGALHSKKETSFFMDSIDEFSEAIGSLKNAVGSIKEDMGHIRAQVDHIANKVDNNGTETAKNTLKIKSAYKRLDNIEPKVTVLDAMKNKGWGILTTLSIVFSVFGAFVGGAVLWLAGKLFP
jgi:peptidoglycan hydrolase CwlO-like protein